MDFFGRFKSVAKLAFSMPKVQPHPVTFLLSLTGFIRNRQRSQLACRTPSAAPGRCCSRRNPAEHLWLLKTAEKWCATNQRTKVVLYVVFGWVNTVPYLGQWTWAFLGYFVVGYQSFKLRPVPRANIGVGIAVFLEVVTIHQSLPRYSPVEHPISAWDIHTEGPSHSTFSDRDIQLMGSPAAESHHFPQLSAMLTRENSGPLEGSHNLWSISWCLMTVKIQWIIWIWGNPNFDLGLQIQGKPTWPLAP